VNSKNLIKNQISNEALQSLPQLIAVLQVGKKASQPTIRPSLDERKTWLLQLEHQLLAHKPELLKVLSEGYSCTEETSDRFLIAPVLAELRSTLQMAITTPEDLYAPQGLIVALAPRVFWFQWVWHAIIQNLLAGNGLVIRPSARTPESLQPVWNLVVEIVYRALNSSEFTNGSEGLVQVVHVSEGPLKEFLIQHPSVNGVMVAGRAETLSGLASLTAAAGKAYSGYGPSSNTALVLGGHETQLVADQLALSCFLFQGQHPCSIKKIICLDQAAKDLYELFVQASARLFQREPGYLQSSHHVTLAEKALAEISQDVGQWLVVPEIDLLKRESRLNFSIIRELPHCSIYQQEELPFPVAMVSSVKYPHEMVRWVNQGDLALGVQIFGDSEKARSLGAKLEAGTVWINQWYDQSSSYSMGMKATLRGQMSCHWNDEFFSRRRRFDSSL
jgi:aminomuconate-semialdehyde/2-hydroxymuconate-6-semialdehyde dehydrogenase